jgi:hypothetical protein
VAGPRAERADAAAVAALTPGSGRATVLQAAVRMVLFAVFLFLAVVPQRPTITFSESRRSQNRPSKS